MRRSGRPNQQSNSLSDQTGSAPAGEPVFLAVGKLRRAHGVSGEILMEIITDFPERLRSGMTLFIGETHSPMSLISARWHDQLLLLSFDGFDTPEEVGRFRNQFVYIKTKSAPPLPEGHYYHHQLIGLNVINTEQQFLGVLSEILETGANDVYVVATPEGEEILLPVIENVILDINLEKREILARPPAWI